MARAPCRLYAVRELTAPILLLIGLDLGVGAFCIGLSPESFRTWVAVQHSAPGVMLLSVGLAASLIHAATWFAVSSKLLPASLARRIPGSTFATLQWVGLMVVASGLIAARLVLGGGT